METESSPQKHLSRAKDAITRRVFPIREGRPSVWPVGKYNEGEPLTNYVVYFAGHGSPQAAGMEKALRQLEPIDSLYSSITASLGYDLGNLTNEQLRQTSFAQPAIAAYNVSSALVHEMANPIELQNKPFTVSGQSAGVSSAGWFANMFGDRATKDAVLLHIEMASVRGEIMQKMKDNPPSGHILISAGNRKSAATEKEKDALEAIRQESLPRKLPVSLAIDISNTRIILGGEKEELKKMHEIYKDRFGGLNLHYFEIPTSCVAFHGKVMEPVEQQIREMFEKLRPEMQDPEIPILSNTYQNPRLLTTVDEYIEEQVRLVTQPVFGRDMDNFLREHGIDTGLEFGERGIIAKSMDGFEISPRSVVIAGTALTAGVALAIGTGYLVRRKGKD